MGKREVESIELKECPFCGGDHAIIEAVKGRNGYFYFVQCGLCEAETKTFKDRWEDYKFYDKRAVYGASDSWNSRESSVESKDSMQLKPCPFCGGTAEYAFNGKPRKLTDGFAGYITVRCCTCGSHTKGIYICGLPDDYSLSETKQGKTVANKWNNRRSKSENH